MQFDSPLTRFTIDQSEKFDGEKVRIHGWVAKKRSSGKVKFLIVRDGTGIMQCILFKKDMEEGEFEKFDELLLESSIVIEGNLRKEPRSPGGFELGSTKITIIDKGQENYPIQPKEHGPDFLLDNRHLWIRSTKQAAVLRIRSEIISASRRFYDSNGFVMMDSPIFTPAACEGTTTLFEVNYFEDKAYLSQSGQLYGEAGAMGLGKIYVFSPAFRAEKSKTRKHLTEFWMIEPEIAFCSMDQAMEVAEAHVKFVISEVLKNKRNDLDLLERDVSSLEAVLSDPFEQMTYEKSLEYLKTKGFDVPWGEDYGAPHEAALGEYNNKPLFITRFPQEIKGFYFKKDPENPRVVLGFDLIAPDGYGELIGGSEREADYDTLMKNVEEHNLPMENFQWYLDLRRYGSVPHAGFGLGLERFVAWVSGVEHIRETIPFPRMLNRISP